MTREDAIYEIKQLAVLSTNKNIERITEALNMAIEALQDEIWKDEPCDKCVFVKGSGWCDNCNGKPKGLDALPNSRKAEQTEPNSSEIPNNCKTEPRKEQNFCGKCRYLYRDFKYGLSCYRLMDNEPCKFEYRKAENSSEKPNNCKECEHWNDTEDGCADRHGCKTEPTISKMEQVDKDINVRSKDEPQKDCPDCEYDDGREWYEEPCGSCWLGNKREPKTDCYVSDLCKHYGDKQICDRCKERRLFLEDESQTEEWYTFQDKQEYNARHGKE